MRYKYIIFLCIFIIFFLAIISARSVGINTCNTLSNSNTTYFLQSNVAIYPPNYCFEIWADNILLEGNNKRVIFNGLNPEIGGGILINAENFTVKNMNIFAGNLTFDIIPIISIFKGINGYGIYLVSNSSVNLIDIQTPNNYISLSKGTDGMIKKYYSLSIKVVDLEGLPLNNVNISIFNINNKNRISYRTNVSGDVNIDLISSIYDKFGEHIYNNYLIEYTKSGYISQAQRLILNNKSFNTIELERNNPFLRGDLNRDNKVDISDIYVLGKYFYGSYILRCRDSADLNDDGRLDISDLAYFTNYYFLGGESIKEPYYKLGPDPTIDELGCNN